MFRKLLLFAISLVLTACNSKTLPVVSIPQAWFDMPLPGTVILPPNPCLFEAHGASLNGVASFEFSINGAVAANIPASDQKKTLAVLNYDCSNLQPGRNQLRLRIMDNAGNWSSYAETSVILEKEGETPSVTPTAPVTETPQPTQTVTSTPTFTPTVTLTDTATPLPAGVSVERLSTNLVYLGSSSCGPLDVTIVARAAAPKGIKVVVLFYRFVTGGSAGEYASVSMNPMGGDLYQRTLNPTSLLNGAIPFDQAALQYQIVVQQSDDDLSVRTPPLSDITVRACGSVTRSCSAYTDEGSCTANGCIWGLVPAMVPLYKCQNP